MSESNPDEFNPEIPVNKLPEGWTVENRYPETVHLNAPDGHPEHIIIQPWDDLFNVMPMVRTASRADAESANQLGDTWETVEGAVEYAVRLAGQLADDYPEPE